MRYSLSLLIDDINVIGLLEPEIGRFKSSRSTIRLSRRGGKGLVEISADDATALRASTDSIMQMLKVYEKMRKQR
jgi:tRNA threonylcarbamoyladenosine modification (KEOPS) complex  Pcc1 subunit